MTTSEPGELRIKELEETLAEVLTHIRAQGHRSWELNTCLVTNEQVTRWAKVVGLTPRWEAAEDARATVSGRAPS
ncbi:hypothetical protein OG413_44590 [Streptomyces sp. NBC_01433]|uniref:hypothetical protein n=1 Tax=Streptomyces sp. NBC_01433 TaxID=2903864 RepID=UPI00225056C7|nr:hypothetical protein [Streptomyces sp. NBC_01433]MCX4682264.1 hypothetical protein [Streptomyces sp. NBC_01433]